MFRNLITSAAVAAILWAAVPEAIGAEADVSLDVLENWSGVFGGRPAKFHCAVTAKKSFQGRAGWSLARSPLPSARSRPPETA